MIFLVVLVAMGLLFVWAGVLFLRDYGSLWLHGIETRARVTDLADGMATLRFEIAPGVERVLRRCTPPRYGRFVEGSTRPITWVPLKRERGALRWMRVAEIDDADPASPLRWNYWTRGYQRSNFAGGLLVVAIGVFLIAMPWMETEGPWHHPKAGPVHESPVETCRRKTGGMGEDFNRCMSQEAAP